LDNLVSPLPLPLPPSLPILPLPAPRSFSRGGSGTLVTASSLALSALPLGASRAGSPLALPLDGSARVSSLSGVARSRSVLSGAVLVVSRVALVLSGITLGGVSLAGVNLPFSSRPGALLSGALCCSPRWWGSPCALCPGWRSSRGRGCPLRCYPLYPGRNPRVPGFYSSNSFQRWRGSATAGYNFPYSFLIIIYLIRSS
jgi:hypothetical protein